MTRGESGSVSTPGVYVWEVPGKSVSIHLSLEVVDRLLQDSMRGFGSVPKRGAEVGGVLLGSLESAEGPRVRVDDYELVPIEYKRGPSYLLSEADTEAFTEVMTRLRSHTELTPVGFFRSQTRDAAGLSPEDLDLLARFLPAPETVVLLIKPYATRVSTAGFYFQENGRYQDGAPLVEFPLRRRELAPDDPGSAPEREEPRVPRAGAPRRSNADAAPPEVRTIVPYPDVQPPRPRWIWFPLSFIFLLLGVLLGFLAASTMRPTTSPGDPYSLVLNADKSGDNLHIKWDRQAPAIRTAQKGILSIEDGAFSKTVDLDASQLQTGSVVYHHNSNRVRFRLEVFPRDRNSLSETHEWSGQ
ncbi:MAG: hypothetical protein M3O35_18170 [Acidobacteriota bacterium]|nr:hypothetical protein [Acidobacteriota bacterium]